MTAIAPERRWTQEKPRRCPQQPVTLRCPETPLGRARAARGWSQAKAVRALLLTARDWGWEIASENSLKVMLCDWEREKRRPGEGYRVLLCAVYRATPEQLGFTTSGPRESAVRAAAPTNRELSERVESLEALVWELSKRLETACGGVA
ncbi:XRE family transcriptional regulator [Streptomyces cacaoi]|uniref:XRE family transcriptional regulator n=1 Tax=Streptomyces cacaoi TaxID=1898 RepID=UPI00262DE72F|nr:XRE family transcriptional regulator [Streptomyces cacaoi]